MSEQTMFNASPFSWEGLSGISKSGADKYPNPFCDIASEYVPRDINSILEWCEYLYLTFGTYRAAARRVVRYFITDLVLEGSSDDERDKYEDFLRNELHILNELSNIGDDFMVYGNVFISLYFPFDRYFICPHCGTTYHCKTVEYKFDMSTGVFRGDCRKCGAHKVEFKREDRRSPDRSRVRIIRWNPKEIRMRVHPISDRIEYYLEIDQGFIQRIRDNKNFYIDDTPWSLLETIVRGNKSKGRPLFKFREDAIYHLRDATLAGLPIKGWAIPPIMPNFKLAYYIQLLRRYDEAIALDFIVPFRVLFPAVNRGPQGNDPLSTMSMGSFVGHMKQMVERKRKNITDVQVAPFQVGYEMIGGEGQNLAPKESIAQALDELLNAIGFPAELYKGSLSIQAFPVALRLFEKSWGVLVDGLNDVLSWILVRLSRHFMWGDINGSLRSVTLADDIEQKALALQSAAGMDISKQTAYRPLGIDYLEEQRRVVEEQAEIQKLQQEAMEDQEAAQAEGAEGGMAEGPGGAPGATPGDVYEQGKEKAQQLLLQTPPSMRRGELIKIKHSNPTLHAIVTQEMDNMRQEFAREGQAMMMEQAKMASAKDTPSPMMIGMLVSDQILEYNRGDLRKMAMDIKRGVKGAKEAFHFIYSRIRGW